MVAYSILAYGILVLAGGVMGYVKSESKPSLITGGIFGALLIVSAWMMMQGNPVAWYMALGLSGFLAVFFIYRFTNTKKFMPAGLMSVLSVAAVAILFLG